MGGFLSYFQELTDAMTMLAQHPKTLFVGQAVKYGGQRAHQTFAGVPLERRIEMPVAEEFQAGFCTGLALEGYIPICFFPRFDFLLVATSAIVNHLDKIPLLGGFRPKVIIRTAVGATKPVDPGLQHTGDYSEPFRKMCKTIQVREVCTPMLDYELAMCSDLSSILVERMELYK